MQTAPLPPAAPPRTYSTTVAAAALRVPPNTLRIAFKEKGEYLGLRPTLLKNRQLLWSAAEVDAIALEPASPAAPIRTYSTATTAYVLQVQPNTLRIGFCEKGEYLGLRPTKLPNRRLLWPAAEVDAIALGHARQSAPASPAAPDPVHPVTASSGK